MYETYGHYNDVYFLRGEITSLLDKRWPIIFFLINQNECAGFFYLPKTILKFILQLN